MVAGIGRELNIDLGKRTSAEIGSHDSLCMARYSLKFKDRET